MIELMEEKEMKKRQHEQAAGLLLVKQFKYKVSAVDKAAPDKYLTVRLPGVETGLHDQDRVHVFKASAPGLVRLRKDDVVLRRVSIAKVPEIV